MLVVLPGGRKGRSHDAQALMPYDPAPVPWRLGSTFMSPTITEPGIHNAWDAVTYHVFTKAGEQPEAERRR